MKKVGGSRSNKRSSGMAVLCYCCWLMLVAVNHPSTAASAAAVSNFEECYGTCFLLCAIIPTNSLSTCTVRCLYNCLIPPSINNSTESKLLFYFCNLGCASYSCSNITTSTNNPREKEVAGCVDSCSQTCTRK